MKIKQYIEPKLLFYLTSFYTTISCVEFLRVYFFLKVDRQLISIQDLILIITIDWLFVIVFMSLVSILTKYLLLKKIKWRWIIFFHIIFSLIQSFAVSFITPLITKGYLRDGHNLVDDVLMALYSTITTNVLLYSTIILIIYTFFYLKQIKAQEERTKILENSMIKFKLKALENQLNPHFLFNSLNTVSGLIETNKKQAQDMLADISELFRKYLDNYNSNTITVRQELYLLNYYVNILKKRFRDDFTYNQQVAFDTLDCKIPRFIIQPLIENSIKHGYAPDNKTLSVEVNIYRNDSYINIEVFNNGAKMKLNSKENDKSGVGIKNINERLAAIYSNDFKYVFKNFNNGVTTIITIPINKRPL